MKSKEQIEKELKFQIGELVTYSTINKNSAMYNETLSIIGALTWVLCETEISSKPGYPNIYCKPINKSEVLNKCYIGKNIRVGDYVKITLLNGTLIDGVIKQIDSNCIQVKEIIYIWILPHTMIKDIEIYETPIN
jgi:hypothetical protein